MKIISKIKYCKIILTLILLVLFSVSCTKQERSEIIINEIEMVSYWNCFHRDKCFRFKNYVGGKLFKECFCPNVNFEK